MKTLRFSVSSQNGLVILNGPLGSRLSIDWDDDDGESVAVSFRDSDSDPTSHKRMDRGQALDALSCFLSGTLEGL